MAGAFVWGTLSASSLVIGALFAIRFRMSLRALGLIMGFGAGVLISAVAFDLVEEASETSSGQGAIALGLFAGCAVFFGGDWLIDRYGGSDRKDSGGDQGSGSALAIVLGTVLDGIPESMVIGLTISEGGAVGVAFLAAVFISNLPESIASTSGPRQWQAGRGRGSSGCGSGSPSSRAGLARRLRFFQSSSPGTVAFVLAFAAGAILTMLADTMMPEAFEHGGKLAGVVTTLGFAVAYAIHTLE